MSTASEEIPLISGAICTRPKGRDVRVSVVSGKLCPGYFSFLTFRQFFVFEKKKDSAFERPRMKKLEVQGIRHTCSA